MCGPDLIRSRSDLVVAGLVGSRRSGASRGDGERRSSMAATLLVLEDAGSPAAAFYGRHSGGLKATKANATGNTQGPGHLHDEPLRRAATLPCAVDAAAFDAAINSELAGFPWSSWTPRGHAWTRNALLKLKHAQW